MKGFIRRTFWCVVIVAYIVGWYFLDQWGCVEWAADTLLQPLVGPEHDAYFGLNAMLLILLIGLGPGVAKGERKHG